MNWITVALMGYYFFYVIVLTTIAIFKIKRNLQISKKKRIFIICSSIYVIFLSLFMMIMAWFK